MRVRTERISRIMLAVALAAVLLAVMLVACSPLAPEPEHRAVRERIAIDARADSYVYNGADIKFYSDDHSTLKAYIDGATGHISTSGHITASSVVSTYNDLSISGDLKVGNGTPGDAAMDGEDAYIEGDSEFDGSAYFDGAVDMDSVLAVGGDITLQNDETIGNGTNGLITLGGGLDLSNTEITDTQSVTPLASTFYIVNSSGAATITMTACSNVGQVVYMYGADANTITVPDSNVRTDDGGAETFGQYDIRGWMCVGTEWALTVVTDNS